MILFDAEGRIASPLYCHACGQDLRSLPVDGQCPQCTRPVAESLAGVLPVLDETGCVVTDVPCVKCGYNLRTRPAVALCPECGDPVAQSLRGHYLNQAPAEWIRRVANGSTLLLIALASAIAMPIIAMGGAFLLAFSGGPMGAAPPIAFMILLWLLGLAFTVVLIWGLVYLTAPDPTMQFKREGLSARRLVRYCLLMLPLMIVGWIITAATQRSFFAPIISPLMIVMSIAGTVAYLVIPLATLRHLAMLMRRVPRLGLVTFAKIEFWGLLISGGVYLCAVVGMMVWTIKTVTPAMTAAMGPNTPTAGPNTPAATANPWAAVNTSKSYQVDPNGVVTLTTVGPGGVTTTTTMPASAPFPAGVLPGPGMMISGIAMGFGTCSMFGFAIAGFIMLILARNALAGAAKQAENNALLVSAAASS